MSLTYSLTIKGSSESAESKSFHSAAILTFFLEGSSVAPVASDCSSSSSSMVFGLFNAFLSFPSAGGSDLLSAKAVCTCCELVLVKFDKAGLFC
ncbi:hypothetical protein WICPIJ_002955 [Wickerhamomyces pijperi]|uniref:Uncharacterized protein n=1 Tax=Wickerhamomyces pijperi TaxID=599730 RepID=A0A9P8TPB9_WICPI|nr:hypothetical protein WICPIJ_002955 [Wickerhamomyces pijperi]